MSIVACHSSSLSDVCRAGDDVGQRTKNGQEEDQNGPTEFRPAVMIMTAEVVDEAPDDEEDHQEDAREDEHRPEQTQERIGVREHCPPNPLG